MHELKLALLNDESVTLLPASANPQLGNLKALRENLVKLLSIWLEYQFSTGEVVAQPEAYELMGKCLSLLTAEGAQVGTSFTGIDRLVPDYQQLEQVFFASEKVLVVTANGTPILDLDNSKPCLLAQMHLFNYDRLVFEARELYVARLEAANPAEVGEGNSADSMPASGDSTVVVGRRKKA